jgi:hypothetical protein
LWYGHEQGLEENTVPKRVLYMNLETARLRGRPRKRWQNEAREDGRTVGERKGYITEINGINSLEWQGIVTFCTFQCN